jgi:hypothetical protein
VNIFGPSANLLTIDGGGIDNQGTATLSNTIIAGQNSGGDINGGYTDGGNNLIGGNPLLAPLGDYGGPTLTMPPLPGSPALGGVLANTPGTPSTDQRGLARNTAATTDIGAVEFQYATTTTVAVLDTANASPVYGDALTFAATVADAYSGAGTPRGSVALNLDGGSTPFDTETLDSDGHAVTQSSITTLGAGGHAVLDPGIRQRHRHTQPGHLHHRGRRPFRLGQRRLERQQRCADLQRRQQLQRHHRRRHLRQHRAGRQRHDQPVRHDHRTLYRRGHLSVVQQHPPAVAERQRRLLPDVRCGELRLHRLDLQLDHRRRLDRDRRGRHGQRYGPQRDRRYRRRHDVSE